MSGEQLPLFSTPATRGASRQSDPWTSRDAGRSMAGDVLPAQQELVLRGFGHIDSTAYEVWLRLQDNPSCPKENVISRRMGELRDVGYLRLTGKTRPGSSRRAQQVHELTEKGREWAAQLLADRGVA